jgi:hypothetical protein
MSYNLGLDAVTTSFKNLPAPPDQKKFKRVESIIDLGRSKKVFWTNAGGI